MPSQTRHARARGSRAAGAFAARAQNPLRAPEGRGVPHLPAARRAGATDPGEGRSAAEPGAGAREGRRSRLLQIPRAQLRGAGERPRGRTRRHEAAATSGQLHKTRTRAGDASRAAVAGVGPRPERDADLQPRRQVQEARAAAGAWPALREAGELRRRRRLREARASPAAPASPAALAPSPPRPQSGLGWAASAELPGGRPIRPEPR